MSSPLRTRALCVALLACAGLPGCAPALDWRDVRPEGSALQLQFPCRPTTQRRDVPLAGARVNLALHACAAGGQTWGLAVADVVEPARVGPALTELAATAGGNVGAVAGQPLALKVPGATPNDASIRLRLQGRLPDGTAVQMHVAVFARGTLVYQATVLGDAVPDEAAQTFFASLRLPS
ncbi:MAG: hypothetical protein Q7U73_13835 [Rubrivivax sp.]|nr:hypothetical protein [Rubrivivax sp.]